MAHGFRDSFSPTIFFLKENDDPDGVNHLCPEPTFSEASTQHTESHWIDYALETLAMGHWAQQSMDYPADSDLAWLHTVPSIQPEANQIEAEDGYTPASNSGAHEISTTPAMVTESNTNTIQPQTSSYQHDALSVA
ncbi:hypothetical protein N7488_012069 [Penicillium malachiteum]|nr:hypothetical protein N7488_012069 [Penicillium malachiteum]